jgi:sugar lactone lactonase YvrE
VSVLSTIRPRGAVPGGRVTLIGSRLAIPDDGPPHVTIGGQPARVVSASSRAIGVLVPDVPGGPLPVRVEEWPSESLVLDVGRVIATGVHQVDSPVCDANGFVYLTHSGSRDNKASVPLYRVGPGGARESISVEIANPTSMAIGPDGSIYVSSRFDGQVYRLTPDLRAELFATDLGVATGLACAGDGTLYVGDRSGTILRITAGGSGESARHVEAYASLPASVAAFHLALGPDGALYVTAPTLASHDVLYRVTPEREVQVVCGGFGRPQGLAFDPSGALFVADALAGGSGLYRVDVREAAPVPELVIAAAHLVGVVFDPRGGMLLASSDTIWRI